MRSQIADLFFQNVLKNPDKIAIHCDGRSLSYSEMGSLVNKISHFLLKSGICYGERVAIPLNNSVESVALFFSFAEIGACLVPLNPTIPFDTLKNNMKFCDIRHIIARKSFYKELVKNESLDNSGIYICLDGEFDGTIPFCLIDKMPDSRPNIINNFTGNESFILTLTSGSTGNPKPIELSQKNKIDRSLAHLQLYKLSSNDIILAATPLYHSLAERLVILPLIFGATSLLLPRFTPEIWIELVQKYKPTFTIAVSSQLSQILNSLKEHGIESIKSFKTIVSSSALLPFDVKNELLKMLPCSFHEMYGTSETSTITDICFNEKQEKSKSVGAPLPGVSIRILRDEDDGICNTFEVGEISCKSPLLCKGYYKMDKVMKSALSDGYFKTGDLGYLDEDGYLFFVGRKKELIITGAINVYPNDVDAVVSKLPEIEECAAFSYPDQRLGEIVALAIVLKDDCTLSERDIRIYCARHLADYQQPHKIFFVDFLPKNSLGKLQRNQIYKTIIENEDLTINKSSKN